MLLVRPVRRDQVPISATHEWAVDFPHLMLRAKAYRFKNEDTKWRDRIIT